MCVYSPLFFQRMQMCTPTYGYICFVVSKNIYMYNMIILIIIVNTMDRGERLQVGRI